MTLCCISLYVCDELLLKKCSCASIGFSPRHRSTREDVMDVSMGFQTLDLLVRFALFLLMPMACACFVDHLYLLSWHSSLGSEKTEIVCNENTPVYSVSYCVSFLSLLTCSDLHPSTHADLRWRLGIVDVHQPKCRTELGKYQG